MTARTALVQPQSVSDDLTAIRLVVFSNSLLSDHSEKSSLGLVQDLGQYRSLHSRRVSYYQLYPLFIRYGGQPGFELVQIFLQG
jgi:hypothetical protein